jgi:hypothetical protein
MISAGRFRATAVLMLSPTGSCVRENALIILTKVGCLNHTLCAIDNRKTVPPLPLGRVGRKVEYLGDNYVCLMPKVSNSS